MGVHTLQSGHILGLAASLVATAEANTDVWEAIADITEGPRRLDEL